MSKEDLKYSEEELQKVSADMTRLFKEARQQCEEHKNWLRARIKEIRLLDGTPAPSIPSLLAEVDKIKVEFARKEPKWKDDSKKKITKETVTIMWDYPDLLVYTLQNDVNLVVPAELKKDFATLPFIPDYVLRQVAQPGVKTSNN